MKASTFVLLLPCLVVAMIVVNKVRDPRVKVAENGVTATFVYTKREAVMQAMGISATTIYRAKDGTVRASTLHLGRVPVSIDRPVNPAQVEFFHRYFR